MPLPISFAVLRVSSRTPRASREPTGSPIAPEPPKAPRFTRRLAKAREGSRRNARVVLLFLVDISLSVDTIPLPISFAVLRVSSRTPRASREPTGSPVARQRPKAPRFTRSPRRSRRHAKNCAARSLVNALGRYATALSNTPTITVAAPASPSGDRRSPHTTYAATTAMTGSSVAIVAARADGSRFTPSA